MLSKISIFSIIKDHIATLKSSQTGKIYYPDIILFFILPAIISAVMIYLGVILNDGLVNALITSLSIFSALLFNLLLLVYDISGKNTDQNQTTDQIEIKKIIQRRELLREIYVNVSFSILTSIITVVILLTYFLKPRSCNFGMINLCLLQLLLASIIYYFSVQFILTLFMILKRIYKLLAKAFDSRI
ncbi:hypothetical protein [Nostoc sp. FACHB-888]|uniref:hypothetical protein n=1 Tax=Nostoc sp. FACHB-888 TaxID=2692842 RepID=UPI00168245ED|nr:hypothetical protein [Nostoc sp. FACHB-888]MBD2242654.1 hypothetical protein [Nostoc sp. FACHB-888]